MIALVGFPQISETIYTPALPSVASGLLASAYMVEATLAIYFLGFGHVLLIGATNITMLCLTVAIVWNLF